MGRLASVVADSYLGLMGAVDIVGFDHRKVATVLKAWLLNARRMSPEEAVNHRHNLHGIPVDRRGTDNPGPSPLCGVVPCKVEAVSLALLEIEHHTGARISTRVEVVTDLQALEALLLEGRNEVARVRAHAEADVARLTQHTAFFKPESLRLDEYTRWGSRPLECMQDLERIFKNIQSLLEETRGQLTSEGVTVPTGGRGRRRLLLIESITRHLVAGGFTHPQISRLVPDDVPGDREMAVDRVRQRANKKNQLGEQDDRRSVRPFDDVAKPGAQVADSAPNRAP